LIQNEYDSNLYFIVWNQDALTITPMENIEQATRPGMHIFGDMRLPKWSMTDLKT
jgi:hypothetical protein